MLFVIYVDDIAVVNTKMYFRILFTFKPVLSSVPKRDSAVLWLLISNI